VPSEEELWGIFHCLARACLVMHRGSENPNGSPPWPIEENVHFDLKQANSMILGLILIET